MPIPSPFHSRTSALCESHEWRNWSGYLAASLYEPSHEREYYAIRNSAALIDVSPLFKYEFSGPEAQRLADRIFTRDIERCTIGQVMYTPWCDDDGKVIDDGTVARLAADHFRVTAAEPNLAWFQDCALGMDVEVRDVTTSLAALAVQGPNSRQVLSQVLADIDLKGLKYYHLEDATLRAGREEFPVMVSRTGYTGDLGYEVWLEPEKAPALWDVLMERGAGYGVTPAGMLALDIARIEAGLIMLQVDYISSRKALIEEQKSSPFELGLGWAVDMKKAGFVGRQALLEEKRRGSAWAFVGLEVDWEALQALFARWDLVPQVAGRASRFPVPVYKEGKHVGQMTSHTFSPLLKRYIGLGMVEAPYASYGAPVEVEATVEYTRQRVRASITKPPFFNPPRKRA
jgi:aminomethyltransferase